MGLALLAAFSDGAVRLQGAECPIQAHQARRGGTDWIGTLVCFLRCSSSLAQTSHIKIPIAMVSCKLRSPGHMARVRAGWDRSSCPFASRPTAPTVSLVH